MQETSTPLSYQTTMPEYPDVTYQTWAQKYGSGGSRMMNALSAWFDGSPNYETWRTNLMDQYNAKMSAYNTWLQSGAGIRASAESGEYNPSYFQGSSSASPLNYQDVNPGNGFSELAQGIQGVLSFAQALQGFKMMGAQIEGQALNNEGIALRNRQQSIINRHLDRQLSLRNDNLSYQADKRQFDLEEALYPRWASSPDLWKSGVFSPYGRGTYQLENADKGLSYQRQVVDIDYLKAGKELRAMQSKIADWTAKEKEWYFNNMLSIQLDIAQKQSSLLGKQVDFEDVRQRVYKSAQIAHIGTDVANTLLRGLSMFMNRGALSPAASGMFLSPHGGSPFPSMVIPGADLADYGAYGSY